MSSSNCHLLALLLLKLANGTKTASIRDKHILSSLQPTYETSDSIMMTSRSHPFYTQVHILSLSGGSSMSTTRRAALFSSADRIEIKPKIGIVCVKCSGDNLMRDCIVRSTMPLLFVACLQAAVFDNGGQ